MSERATASAGQTEGVRRWRSVKALFRGGWYRTSRHRKALSERDTLQHTDSGVFVKCLLTALSIQHLPLQCAGHLPCPAHPPSSSPLCKVTATFLQCLCGQGPVVLGPGSCSHLHPAEPCSGSEEDESCRAQENRHRDRKVALTRRPVAVSSNDSGHPQAVWFRVNRGEGWQSKYFHNRSTVLKCIFQSSFLKKLEYSLEKCPCPLNHSNVS